LLPLLDALDEPALIRAYFPRVLARDVAVDPGALLEEVCRKAGWATFQPELTAAFRATTASMLERNVRLLEQVCLARPRKKTGWPELCEALARALIEAVEGLDGEKETYDWRAREVKRADVLAGLARSLLATGQDELLSRLVDHALGLPKKYPLRTAHAAALTALRPWLKVHVKKPSEALSRWVASCCEQLEALAVAAPQKPTDYRRAANISCDCADCAELKKFLASPHENVRRFPISKQRRRHLHSMIDQHQCDVTHATQRTSQQDTLVCTKKTASYQTALKTYQEDQENLAALRAIQAVLEKRK
jgi:hypothetical protein